MQSHVFKVLSLCGNLKTLFSRVSSKAASQSCFNVLIYRDFLRTFVGWIDIVVIVCDYEYLGIVR